MIFAGIVVKERDWVSIRTAYFSDSALVMSRCGNELHLACNLEFASGESVFGKDLTIGDGRDEILRLSRVKLQPLPDL